MLRYAAAKQFSIKLGYNIKISTRKFHQTQLRQYALGDYKNINDDILTSKAFRQFRLSKPYRMSTDNYSLDIDFDNVYMIDSWFDQKYFLDIKTELIKIFDYKTKNLIPECNSVALHVRRGDFYNVEKVAKRRAIDLRSYFKRALNIVKYEIDNPVIFIFSDDIKWVMNNINIPFEHYYISGNTAIEDMHLMKSCKHIIMSHSSFSWWSAWLSNNTNKLVICPNKWKLISHVPIEDRSPDYWRFLDI